MKKKNTPQYRFWSKGAVVVLTGLLVFCLAREASAGPITNPGGAPYAKLSVYQGVLSIVPNGSGDSVMEIGNAGRDIKSTGDINITPTGDVHITTGRLCFGTGTSSCSNTWGAATTWTLDAVLAAGNSTTRAATVGGLTVTGTTTLGNTTIGSATTPTGKLVINNGTTGSGSAGDALSAYTNSDTTAIYGEQRGNGWYAGYFSHGVSGRNGANSQFVADGTLYADNLYESAGSTVVNANAGMFVGDVEIRQKNAVLPAPGQWPAGDVLKVLGNSANPAPGGYVLDVVNASPTGYAAGFTGAVQVAAQSSPALSAFSTKPGGTGIYGQGGAYPSGGDGSIGVLGQGQSVLAGQSSYGIYGAPAIGGAATYLCGNGTGGGNCYSVYGKASNGNGTARTYAVYGESGLVGGGAISYAGYFQGRLVNNGLNALSMVAITAGTSCTTTCTNASLACAFVVVPGGGSTQACSNSTGGNICVCQSQ